MAEINVEFGLGDFHKFFERNSELLGASVGMILVRQLVRRSARKAIVELLEMDPQTAKRYVSAAENGLALAATTIYGIARMSKRFETIVRDAEFRRKVDSR